MRKIRDAARRYPLVGATILIGLIVLVTALLGYTTVAQVLATIYVGGVVLWTVVDMIRDMMAGNFGLDVLAVMAMVATLAVGEYGASIIIVLMLTGGEALEDYASNRAKSALTALLEQAPQTAHRFSSRQGDKDEAIEDVPAAQVRVGDHLLVRPGEVVPVDAKLLSKRGSFDESAITGESLPVSIRAGGEVPSGSLNGDEAVRLEALRTTENSQYQQIVALVADAEKQKAPVVRIADRFAVPFTALALIIAGTAWFISGDAVRFAEVLVLATPCPLLIAAPVAFMGGLSRSAKNGVIFKGGAVIESLSNIRSAAFDKTGTITGGRPEVVRVDTYPGFDESEVLKLAASAEQYSAHVLAVGIVAAAKGRGLGLLAAETAEETAGSGVSATFGQRRVVIGSRHFVLGTDPSYSIEDGVKLEPGEVASYMTINGEPAGVIVLADQMRPDAPALVAYLRDQGVETIEMLTGDGESTAREIGAQAGIADVRYSLRPEQKVALVHDLQPRPALMVGDGVNDAPALASADVGIAMGARGATAAGEAADAVIVPDSVWKVADAHTIAKQTMRVALTAIWIGIILSVGLMLVAATGAIPAMVGALTQEIVDLAAILYALRALSGKLPSKQKYLAQAGQQDNATGRVLSKVGR
ncbi:heavy metal translocating P-type ATPase [Schaalia sp. JY-X159]|uniref:heavy metal translocating P-type ATPase n=1 Tax=Schaalia sp. JY-X159 TaxID=2758575 RepID=UPI00165DF801|nr:heavy metal translocating P-type ATPase [Schaalia sp. JY-X159]